MWLQQRLKNIDDSSVPLVYDVRKEVAETCYRFCFYITLPLEAEASLLVVFFSQISEIRAVQHHTKQEQVCSHSILQQNINKKGGRKNSFCILSSSRKLEL